VSCRNSHKNEGNEPLNELLSSDLQRLGAVDGTTISISVSEGRDRRASSEFVQDGQLLAVAKRFRQLAEELVVGQEQLAQLWHVEFARDRASEVLGVEEITVS